MSFDTNAVRAALSAVKDAYLNEENLRDQLNSAASVREQAIRELHALTNGTPINIDGVQLTSVLNGGKGQQSVFLRGVAQWLGFDRKPSAKAAPKAIITL